MEYSLNTSWKKSGIKSGTGNRYIIYALLCIFDTYVWTRDKRQLLTIFHFRFHRRKVEEKNVLVTLKISLSPSILDVFSISISWTLNIQTKRVEKMLIMLVIRVKCTIEWMPFFCCWFLLLLVFFSSKSSFVAAFISHMHHTSITREIFVIYVT